MDNTTRQNNTKIAAKEKAGSNGQGSLWTMLLVLWVLSGCASTQTVEPGLLDLEGVELTDQSPRYLQSVTLIMPAVTNKPNTLPYCAARTVPNQQVTLQDSEGTFFGAFTGAYYRNTNMREVGGSDGTRYVSPDGQSLVTIGTAKYVFSFLGGSFPRAIRYKLAIDSKEDATQYLFSDIQQAQIDTGAAANTGFDPVGAWPTSRPGSVHRELRTVATAVNACIANRESPSFGQR